MCFFVFSVKEFLCFWTRILILNLFCLVMKRVLLNSGENVSYRHESLGSYSGENYIMMFWDITQF